MPLSVISNLSTSASAEIMYTSHWLSSIPERLGTSDALDKATHCFATHHMGIIQNNKQMTSYAREAYGQALWSLQKALYDPVEVTTSETLCAASLLCLYEVSTALMMCLRIAKLRCLLQVFACTKPESWRAHADGIGRLVRMRGPESHRSGFDNCMFIAFRGMIVSMSVSMFGW